MAQISINNKTEETELLKEYIVMEKDKLEEGKKTFHEDTEKYQKFKLDLTAKSQQTEDEVRKVQSKIESLHATIISLKKQEAEQLSKESKLEEEIVLHKASKKFLDLLAIASKSKKPVNQKKRRQMKQLLERNANETAQAEAAMENARASDGGHTFLTQTSQMGHLQLQKKNLK